MKFTICGFQQQRVLELGLNVEELVFLDWFMQWRDSGGMEAAAEIIEGKPYYWLRYDYVLKQLPAVVKSERSLSRMIAHLEQCEVLTSSQKRLGKGKGTKRVFRPGPAFAGLVRESEPAESHTPAKNGDPKDDTPAKSGEPNGHTPAKSGEPDSSISSYSRNRGDSRKPAPKTSLPMNQTTYDSLVTKYGKQAVTGYIERIRDWHDSKGKACADYAAVAKRWMHDDAVPKRPTIHVCPDCGSQLIDDLCFSCRKPIDNPIEKAG